MNGTMLLNSELMNVLAVAGADKDSDGKYVVRGDLCSFLGLGDEWVIGETAQYSKAGEWRSILGIAQVTSYHRPIIAIF